MKAAPLTASALIIVTAAVYLAAPRQESQLQRRQANKERAPITTPEIVSNRGVPNEDASVQIVPPDPNRLRPSSRADADFDLDNPERYRDPETELPEDMQKQLAVTGPVELPADLREQLNSPSAEIPEDMRAQLGQDADDLSEDLIGQIKIPRELTPN